MVSSLFQPRLEEHVHFAKAQIQYEIDRHTNPAADANMGNPNEEDQVDDNQIDSRVNKRSSKDKKSSGKQLSKADNEDNEQQEVV